MTTIARTTRTGEARRRVTGTPAEVATTVALIRGAGRLVAFTTPRQLDPHNPHDPRVSIVVTLRTPTPVRYTRRWVAPAVITTASAAAVTATGYGLVHLAHTVAREVTSSPHAIAGALILVLVLVVVAKLRRTSCPGLHCTGCRRH